jgi:hypothetical protein
MVYTRFGNVVTIVGKYKPRLSDRGALWYQCRREDGTQKAFTMADLKADGGSLEIEASAKDVPVIG